MLMGLVLITSFACQNKPADGEQNVESEGEETGPSLTINEKYDHVRNGVRLILAFDSEASAFMGTVENVTREPIKSVRVEVHLSNGVELGPTKPVDLPSGSHDRRRSP